MGYFSSSFRTIMKLKYAVLPFCFTLNSSLLMINPSLFILPLIYFVGVQLVINTDNAETDKQAVQVVVIKSRRFIVIMIQGTLKYWLYLLM